MFTVWILFAAVLCSADQSSSPGPESLDLIEAFRQAQRSNIDRHPAGELTAEVVQNNIQHKMRSDARVRVLWDKTRIRREVTIEVAQPEGIHLLSPKAGEVIIDTPKESIQWNPKLNQLLVSPPGRFQTPEVCLCAPREFWYSTSFMVDRRPWHEVLDPSFQIAEGLAKDVAVTKVGRVHRFIRTYSENNRYSLTLPPLTVDFSLEQGGNVVAFHQAPHLTAKKERVAGSAGRAEWVSDGAGGFRLSFARIVRFDTVPEEPIAVLEFKVNSFKILPAVSDAEFSREQFTLKDGTELREYSNVPGQAPRIVLFRKGPRPDKVSEILDGR